MQFKSVNEKDICLSDAKVTRYHQGYLPLSHRTEHSFSFSICIENKKREDFARSRILYFPEEGTLEAQARYSTRIVTRFVTSLYVRKQEELRTACY